MKRLFFLPFSKAFDEKKDNSECLKIRDVVSIWFHTIHANEP